MEQRAGHVKEGFAGADPGALAVRELDVECFAAFGCHCLEKLHRETRGTDNRPPHEYRISRRAIAEMSDNRLGFKKVAVGLRCEVVHRAHAVIASRAKQSRQSCPTGAEIASSRCSSL